MNKAAMNKSAMNKRDTVMPRRKSFARRDFVDAVRRPILALAIGLAILPAASAIGQSLPQPLDPLEPVWDVSWSDVDGHTVQESLVINQPSDAGAVMVLLPDPNAGLAAINALAVPDDLMIDGDVPVAMPPGGYMTVSLPGENAGIEPWVGVIHVSSGLPAPGATAVFGLALLARGRLPSRRRPQDCPK